MQETKLRKILLKEKCTNVSINKKFKDFTITFSKSLIVFVENQDKNNE